jgi:hypothetical protein
VAVKEEALTEAPTTTAPETPREVPGVVVPIPTLPFERTVKAVEVAPRVGSAKMEKRFLLERDEVAETVRSAVCVLMVDVPMPRYEAIEESAVVLVAVKLVKVKLPPLVRLKPAAS